MDKTGTDQNSLVQEYVQNLVDVVSEQISLHVLEMKTLDQLNALTLHKQRKTLASLQAQPEDVGPGSVSAGEMGAGIAQLEASVDCLEANLDRIELLIRQLEAQIELPKN